jgi:ribosomal protein L7/L12
MPAIVNHDETKLMTVSYPVREAQQTISHGDYYAVRCIGAENKVRAIKFIRMQHGLGLYESKQVVEAILDHPDALAAILPTEQASTTLGALLRSKLDNNFA